KVDTLRGATYIFTGRYLPERKSFRQPFGTLFFKNGEFIFALRGGKLYFFPANAGNGKWNYNYVQAAVLSEEQLPPGDRELHHFALTLSRHVEPEQGTDYTDVKLYLDGVRVGGRRFDHYEWRDAGFPLVAGGITPANDTFDGKYWDHPGSVAALQVLDKALTDDEIRQLVQRDKRIVPRFVQPETLTDEERRMLDWRGYDWGKEFRAWFAALTNAALAGRPDWRRIYRATLPVKSFRGPFNFDYRLSAAGGGSVLTILDDGRYATIASFYDPKAERELLAWNNPFFEVTFLNAKGRGRTVTGADKNVTRRLSSPPVLKDGVWEFAFRGESVPTEKFPYRFAYTMNCRFVDDRLEYDLEVTDDDPSGRLAAVRFPALRLNTFRDGGDTLLVPRMSGVELQDAAAVGANYHENYPRGGASLQMGAYYDAKGGAMFAVADARARAKGVAFSVGREVSNFNFSWLVPISGGVETPTVFAPRCRAELQLFRGGWYDAGLAYRAMLERLRPPWWRSALPDPECPAWFRDNTIWIGRWQNYKDYRVWLRQLDDLATWKRYVGTPGQAVHFYEWCLHFTRDWPHNPASPDFVDRTRAMQRAGYRVVPYINARIWEDKDKRDEDYRFTRVGLPATVKTADGKPSPEPYAPYMFYVVCPATRTYEAEMFRECDNCVIHGADGAYLDQVGAGRHLPCFARDHGHLPADPDVWYMQGHRKVYRKLRERWKTLAPEGATIGEDISEAVVGVLDGGLTWRWMYNGQVGLFPLIYSGRTQMAGIAWAGGRRGGSADIAAVPAKLTFQLFNNCQLGWFSIDYLVQPKMKPYRKLVKQYAHLRVAMLDFFNAGMMARPPRWAKPQIRISRLWGYQGTRNVATEPLQSCAWEYRGVRALLAANTGEARAENTLLTVVPKDRVHLFFSDGRREELAHPGGEFRLPVALEPCGFVAAVAVPEGRDAAAVLAKFAAAFEVVAKADHEPDPWSK
ncbi:MAG: hypothetical protein IJJ28_08595, partial [Lentisphaeria bacterium]|nr:hypothetical protein [Lentisphaeria bacterium]